MTHHPQHLHALAALHSLAAAWPHLQRAVRAARAAGADDADRGTLQAWRPNSGGSGGSGPARSAVLDAVARPGNGIHPVLRAAANVEGGILWAAGEVRARRPDVRATLRALAERLPQLPPRSAAGVARHLVDADRLARRWANLPPDDHEPLPGVDCPGCGVRDLAWRMSAPPELRVVVCGAGCLCAGVGCGCGMGVREAEVPHVWTRAELGQPTMKESSS